MSQANPGALPPFLSGPPRPLPSHLRAPPVEFIVRIADVFDLDVPTEVGQCDIMQFTLQSHQLLLGHCGWEKAGSQLSQPASL